MKSNLYFSMFFYFAVAILLFSPGVLATRRVTHERPVSSRFVSRSTSMPLVSTTRSSMEGLVPSELQGQSALQPLEQPEIAAEQKVSIEEKLLEPPARTREELRRRVEHYFKSAHELIQKAKKASVGATAQAYRNLIRAQRLAEKAKKMMPFDGSVSSRATDVIRRKVAVQSDIAHRVNQGVPQKSDFGGSNLVTAGEPVVKDTGVSEGYFVPPSIQEPLF